jgi:hypothetical protein
MAVGVKNIELKARSLQGRVGVVVESVGIKARSSGRK